jgi:hypothetical protein
MLPVVVHHLAEVPRLVAPAVEPSGEGATMQVPGLELLPTPGGGRIAVDLGVVNVLPPEEGRSSGAAQGEGGGHVRELHALPNDVAPQGVHLVLRPRHLVVGEHEDDVGPLLRSPGRLPEARVRAEEGHEDEARQQG